MIPCKREGITLKTYIEKEPVFSDSIQLTETTDPGNAEYINISTKQIFANTLVNQKEIREGDSKNKIITFDSMDSKKADKWTDVAMMESGEKHKSLIEKISIMFKNVRYLYKLLGTTDISKIEDGTVTGAIKKVNKALKPIDAENRIEEMTSINQITSVGFWKIATIENNYAHEIGIDNNVGDFYAIVSNYNGNGTDRYTFGDLLLFSPRLQGYHYAINIWNENAQARLVLTNDNILTTKEQINANTDLRNIAGATAMKEMFSEINSNLYYKSGDVIEYRYYLWICGTLTGGNKEIWITIPLNKPILGTPKITLTPYMFIVRQNGLYLKNITSSTDFIDSGIEVQTRGHVNGTGITFIFVEHNGFGGDNNDAVTVCMAYKITFV